MGRLNLDFLRIRSAVREFERQEKAFREVVFYSESAADWPHMGPVIERLLAVHDRKISYLTSDLTDPGLQLSDPRFRAFHIGTGTARTVLFRRIDCAHFVMTLPDLQSLWLKRSVHPVHYVYLFHSINSTHTSYRKGAFDAYDTILCVGPHHVAEIRRTEQEYGLRPKQLVDHGSVKLDAVISAVAGATSNAEDASDPRVLVAPSWGESSLIEQPLGRHLIETMLAAGIRTAVRLHPMTVRRFPKLGPALTAEYAGDRFSVESDMSATQSWVGSNAMVSDWSGAATEYAFALQRPVVFVDTVQKIRNPEWKRIDLPAVEDVIRREIGRVVAPSEIHTAAHAVRACITSSAELRQAAVESRARFVFNVGRASHVGADYLASVASARSR